MGDMPAAQAEISAMQALADRTGLPLVRWHVLRRRASAAALTGSFDGCRRLAAQAAKIAVNWHDDSVRGIEFGQSVCLALVRGDPADLNRGWTRSPPANARSPSSSPKRSPTARSRARSCCPSGRWKATSGASSPRPASRPGPN